MSDRPITRFTRGMEAFARDAFGKAQAAFQAGDLATGERHLADLDQTVSRPDVRQRLEFLRANADRSYDEGIRAFGNGMAKSLLDKSYLGAIPSELRDPARNPNAMRFAAATHLINQDAQDILRYSMVAKGSDPYNDVVADRIRRKASAGASANAQDGNGQAMLNYEETRANALASAAKENRLAYAMWLTGLPEARDDGRPTGRVSISTDEAAKARDAFKANEARLANLLVDADEKLVDLGAGQSFRQGLLDLVDKTVGARAGRDAAGMEMRARAYAALADASAKSVEAGLGTWFATALWERVARGLPGGFSGSQEFSDRATAGFVAAVAEVKGLLAGDDKAAERYLAEAWKARGRDPDLEREMTARAEEAMRPAATAEDVEAALSAMPRDLPSAEGTVSAFRKVLGSRLSARDEYGYMADSAEHLEAVMRSKASEALYGYDPSGVEARFNRERLDGAASMDSPGAHRIVAGMVSDLARNAEMEKLAGRDFVPTEQAYGKVAAGLVSRGVVPSLEYAKEFAKAAFASMMGQGSSDAPVSAERRLSNFMASSAPSFPAHRFISAAGDQEDYSRAVARLGEQLESYAVTYQRSPEALREVERSVRMLSSPEFAPRNRAEAEELSRVASLNASRAATAKAEGGTDMLKAAMSGGASGPIDPPYATMRKEGFDTGAAIAAMEALGYSRQDATLRAAKALSTSERSHDKAIGLVANSLAVLPSDEALGVLLDAANNGSLLGSSVRFSKSGDVDQSGNFDLLLKKGGVEKKDRKVWVGFYKSRLAASAK